MVLGAPTPELNVGDTSYDDDDFSVSSDQDSSWDTARTLHVSRYVQSETEFHLSEVEDLARSLVSAIYFPHRAVACLFF